MKMNLWAELMFMWMTSHKDLFETQAKEDSEMAYLNHGFGVNSIEWDITKDSPRDIFNDKYDVISN